MTRRDFLKGFIAAAAYVSIPAKELLELSVEAEALNYNIFWVSPKDYVAYEKALKPEYRFGISKLAQYEHLVFRGDPVIPHEHKRTPKTDVRWERFNGIISS